MKTLPAILFAATLLTVAAGDDPVQNAVPPETVPPPAEGAKVPGRFQLLAAAVSQTDGSTEQKVFRIDTATGQAWTYEETSGDYSQYGGPSKLVVIGWSPISESFGNDSLYYMKAFKPKPATPPFSTVPTPLWER
jgi:hypothetical protein